MSSPVLLFAAREFRAYVATLSFWIALAVGPVAMAVVVALLALAGARPSPMTTVSIQASSAENWRLAAAALDEAAQLEGRRIVVLPMSDRDGASRVTVTGGANGLIQITGSAPLSPVGRALVERTLQRDAALARLGEPPAPLAAPDLRPPIRTDRTAAAGSAAARFALVMALWLTLTGSLGMLLQAVVRERANNALESLLAAATPSEIVAGKVLGVGAVSMLVLIAWLGAGAALAPLAPSANGLGAALAHGISSPVALVRATLIYVLAYGFYSLVTVAIGAGARDSAQAQNLSRPMFAVLLAAFFAALSAAAGAGRALAWLLYVPPFAPFMLLLAPEGSLVWSQEVLAISLLTGATWIAGRLAAGRLRLSPAAA